MSHKVILQVGTKFGNLEVIGDAAAIGKRERSAYTVRCVCGKEKVMSSEYLRKRGPTSCGCLAIGHRTTHGEAGSITYIAWQSMRRRCTEKSHKDFDKYSKLGYDKSWDNYEMFRAAVGVRPSKAHTLDRIDNSVGYFPGNIRWASWTTQQRNRTNNVQILFLDPGGVTRQITLAEAIEISGRTRATVQLRLCRYGKSIQEALGPGFSWPNGINPYAEVSNG